MNVMPPRLPARIRLLWAIPMRRWTSTLGAILLVLMLWTSGLAQAAEQARCIPPAAESVVHFEGDGDEAPAKGEQETAHHHTGCGGHQVAAGVDYPRLDLQSPSASFRFQGRQAGSHGHDPDGQLRPPIA